MQLALFIVFGVVAAATAITVVAARNPIHSAISLVGTFFSLACIYVLLQAHFLAVIQVLVYAGAIMVLFLFVIMLLNLTPRELGRARITAAKIGSAVIAAGLALVFAVWLLTPAGSEGTALAPAAEGTATWAGGTVASVGALLFTDYLLPFEIVSILLIIAIVGAVIIARKRS